MTKEMLVTMLAALTLDQRGEALTAMGFTAEAVRNDYLTLAAAEATKVTVPVTQPVFTPAPPAAVTTAVAPPPAMAVGDAGAGSDLAAITAQLATERTARHTAECSAFMASMATRVTPAEAVDVQKLYMQLAALSDNGAALAQYKNTIQARPVNPMMSEQVQAAGVVGATVLGQQGGAVDTRTEAQKEADTVRELLAMTEGGQQAMTALQAGAVPFNGGTRAINLGKAFEQFAVHAPVNIRQQ